MDAASIFFGENAKLAFYHLPRETKEVTKLIKLGEERLFLLERREKSDFAMYSYKGEFHFFELTRHLTGFAEGDKNTIDKMFDYKKIAIGEVVKEEL